MIFFGWSQPNYLWIILLNIIINYSCAVLIDDVKTLQKPLLVVTVAANLAILFYFKYFNFVEDSINKVLGADLQIVEIILPIGISFFTFQGMSYVIDVYRKDVPVQKNIFKLALYIVLFPQLIAGPIVRYKDIASEIDDRRVTIEDFSYGIEQFIIGLGKKAIIANSMASMVDSIWNNGATENTWIIAWIGSIGYTLQIYFDFSGYSDMAIGLGRMFGFHFNENFNMPYISKNISEFWRRWHISLSSWFKDYVYIPLGGNRKHVYLNLAIVFLLTGIWHGASWHYIAWGVWNGAFILIERAVRKNREKRGVQVTKSWMKDLVAKIYTLFIVNLGWVIFRAPHTRDAVEYIATMFGIIVPKQVGFSLLWYLDRWSLTMMILGIIFASSLPSKVATMIKKNAPEPVETIVRYILLILVFYIAIMRIVAGTYNPFIYFQF